MKGREERRAASRKPRWEKRRERQWGRGETSGSRTVSSRGKETEEEEEVQSSAAWTKPGEKERSNREEEEKEAGREDRERKEWRGWRSRERAEALIPGYSGSHECMELSPPRVTTRCCQRSSVWGRSVSVWVMGVCLHKTTGAPWNSVKVDERWCLCVWEHMTAQLFRR